MREIPDVYVDILGIPGDCNDIGGIGAIGDEQNRLEPSRLHTSALIIFAKTEIYSYVLNAGERGLSAEEIAQDLQEVAGRWFDNVDVSVSSDHWSFVIAGDFVRRRLDARDYEAHHAALASIGPDFYAERLAL